MSAQASLRRGAAARPSSIPPHRLSNDNNPLPSATVNPPKTTAPSHNEAPVERQCVLWVHDEKFSKEEVIFNHTLLPAGRYKLGQLMAIVPLKNDALDKKPGSLAASQQLDASIADMRSSKGSLDTQEDAEKQYLFTLGEMNKETASKHPNLEISVAKHVADVFGFKHRSNVLVTTTTAAITTASHVEMSFKDEYLSRSDMWRLTLAKLSNKTVYKGQKLVFMGTIKAQITSVYVSGRKVQSAFFSTNTKPIFRSESARYVLFIQMSKEMWDFDSEGSGEIVFTKVVNGFLPALFKRWVALKAKHLVSIVLFTRVEYDTGLTSDMEGSGDSYYTGYHTTGSRKPYKDFYRVVVSEMASGEWTTILYQLKVEFHFFRHDISMFRLNKYGSKQPTGDFSMGSVPGTRVEAEPTFAVHGNLLEAINLASSSFSSDYIDRDLIRTGISIVIITPCAGLFEVDYEKLKATTDSLIGSGIAIDLVCLPKIPLHSVPLLRYRNPLFDVYQESLRVKDIGSESSTPRQSTTAFGSFNTLQESLSPSKASELQQRLSTLAPQNAPEEWNYAIPHWLDVSFWTGASQELLAKQGGKISKAYRRKGIVKPRKNFQIRCKMYEIEMLGHVENTEISVPPLPDRIRQLGRSEGDEPSIVKAPRKPFSGIGDPLYGPTRPVVDKKSTTAEKDFFELLEAFDEKAAVVSKPGRSKIVSPKLDMKKYPKLSNETHEKKKSIDGKISAPLPHREIPKAQNQTLTIPETNNNGLLGTTSRKTSISSTNSQATSHSSLLARPFKVSRQISFGFRGFGIAAPKAAVAEVHTEHANAARLTSQSQTSTPQKDSSSAMASHLTSSSRFDRTTNRPASSRGSIRSKESDRNDNAEDTDKFTSRPIAIKSPFSGFEANPQSQARSILGSLYEGGEVRDDDDLPTLQKLLSNDTIRTSKSKLLAGPASDFASLPQTVALSPWLNVLNPSNPTAADNDASQYKRWQHIFPGPVVTKAMKWKSLCSPASVPLTTEYFPTKVQLDTEFQQKPYNISQNIDEDMLEVPKTRGEFLRELVALRLSHGFQIVVGTAVAEAFGQKALKIANAFEDDHIAEDGTSIFLSMGNIIHQLSCVNGTEVEVNMFTRKSATFLQNENAETQNYKPAIRTYFDSDYACRDVALQKPLPEYNWNYVDSFIAGHNEDITDNLRYWRARFVLIPVERPAFLHRPKGEDTEEEIRLEGIKALTQMWQRHRYTPPSERRFQNLSSRRVKDPNPLDIWYQTQDPSVVIAAELETLPILETGEAQIKRGQLLSEKERFKKSNLNIGMLAEAIQAPVEKGGVRMQNRRWHFRLHYNCFIGSDMTTWLLENIEDIETREEAIEFGNMLMVNDEERRANTDSKEKEKDFGIFVHVEKRHPFRDGQYFYQVVGEHAKPRPETRTGWPFGPRRRDTKDPKDISVPTTPMTENAPKESPKPERTQANSINDENKSTDPGTEPPTPTARKPKVSLSNVMKYDVDPRKRSYRPERINLHYDRIHNPDNCYHIRLDWMNVTAKLIEDAIASWTLTADRYGLRLVEAPIAEACTISSSHPFRAPYHLKLALPPPEKQPPTDFDATSLAPISSPQKHYYQKAIMKKFNFVLDTEAAANFPTNVEVIYSWGKPNYAYSQYIHRSGTGFAQITDEGDFLLTSNKMFNSRTHIVRDNDRFVPPPRQQTPISSPMLRATMASPGLKPSPVAKPSAAVPTFAGKEKQGPDVAIKDDMERFCNDVEGLRRFYAEVWEKATTSAVMPTPPVFKAGAAGAREAAATAAGLVVDDANIPVLGLGPGLTWMGGNNGPIGSFRDARGELREGWGSFRDAGGFGSLRTPSFRRGSEHASDSGSGSNAPKGE
ncbi:vacuolar membrane-associated protein iml1 [Pseudogymnoascus verrucosus]|uniref:Vacuolar membrane-associated protein IML1 n=1 Tax=Pseudogymnoascus verrucosus TaxID=342668 RepID=A0A1B8GX08_9PEZI|nr:vacuolar membrane-associated protein iml1 [Pseudogymnoascus verrucosus]OBU00341.1 vacuolar membrane-associated protein iml1 [Pseudogymnoascus verrucosus]